MDHNDSNYLHETEPYAQDVGGEAMENAPEDAEAIDASDSAHASAIPPSFSILTELSMNESVLLSKWAPTMDLIAVVTYPATLTVRRLNWQPLFSINVEAVGEPKLSEEQLEKLYGATNSATMATALSGEGGDGEEEEEDDDDDIDWSKFKNYDEYNAWVEQREQEKAARKAALAASRSAQRDTFNVETLAESAMPGAILTQVGDEGQSAMLKVKRPLVRCLEWRPDSRVLAVGLATGAVALYSIDLGQRIMWFQAAESAISALSWTMAEKMAQDCSFADVSSDMSLGDSLINLQRITKPAGYSTGTRSSGAAQALWAKLLPGFAITGALPWPFDRASEGKRPSEGGGLVSSLEDVPMTSSAITAARIPFVPSKRPLSTIVASSTPAASDAVKTLDTLCETLAIVEASSSVANELCSPPGRSRLPLESTELLSVSESHPDAFGVCGLSFLMVASLGTPLILEQSKGGPTPLRVNLRLYLHGGLPVAHYVSLLPRHVFQTVLSHSLSQTPEVQNMAKVPTYVNPASVALNLVWSSSLESVVIGASSQTVALRQLQSNDDTSPVLAAACGSAPLFSQQRLHLSRLPALRPHLHSASMSILVSAKLLRSVGQVLLAMHSRWSTLQTAFLRKLGSLKSSLKEYYCNTPPAVETDQPVFQIHSEQPDSAQAASYEEEEPDPFNLAGFAEEPSALQESPDTVQDDDEEADPFGLAGFADSPDRPTVQQPSPSQAKTISTGEDKEGPPAPTQTLVATSAPNPSDVSGKSSVPIAQIEAGPTSRSSDTNASPSDPPLYDDEWALVRRELIAALLDGSPAPPLQTFFKEYVDLAYVERFSKASQSVFEELGAILRTKLQPRAEALLVAGDYLRRLMSTPLLMDDVHEASRDTFSDSLKTTIAHVLGSAREKGSTFAENVHESRQAGLFHLALPVSHLAARCQDGLTHYLNSITELVRSIARLSADLLAASAAQKAFMEWLEEVCLRNAARQELSQAASAPNQGSHSQAQASAAQKLNAADKIAASLDLNLVKAWLFQDLRIEDESRIGRYIVFTPTRKPTEKSTPSETSSAWIQATMAFNAVQESVRTAWSHALTSAVSTATDNEDLVLRSHSITLATIDDPSDGYVAFEPSALPIGASQGNSFPIVEPVGLATNSMPLTTKEAMITCPALGALTVVARQVQLDTGPEGDEGEETSESAKEHCIERGIQDILSEPRTELLEFYEESSEARRKLRRALLQTGSKAYALEEDDSPQMPKEEVPDDEEDDDSIGDPALTYSYASQAIANGDDRATEAEDVFAAKKDPTTLTAVVDRLGTLPGSAFNCMINVAVLNTHSIGVLIDSEIQLLSPIALVESNASEVRPGGLMLDESNATIENWQGALGVQVTFSTTGMGDDVRVVAARVYGYDKVIALLRRRAGPEQPWYLEIAIFSVSSIPAQYWKGGSFGPLIKQSSSEKHDLSLTTTVLTPTTLTTLSYTDLSPRVRAFALLGSDGSSLIFDVCPARGVACVLTRDPFAKASSRVLVLDLETDDVQEE